MNIIKFGSLVPRLVHKNALLQRLSMNQLKSMPRLKSSKSESTGDDDELNKPIKFSTSGASTWDPVSSRVGPDDDSPEYQSYVILGSIAVFLIYFCILREENDIDEQLTMNLTEHFSEKDANILLQSQNIAIDYANQHPRQQ